MTASVPGGPSRTAQECRIRWQSYWHPRINRSPWSSEEVKKLKGLITEIQSQQTSSTDGEDTTQATDWVYVAEQLGVRDIHSS